MKQDIEKVSTVNLNYILCTQREKFHYSRKEKSKGNIVFQQFYHLDISN